MVRLTFSPFPCLLASIIRIDDLGSIQKSNAPFLNVRSVEARGMVMYAFESMSLYLKADVPSWYRFSQSSLEGKFFIVWRTSSIRFGSVFKANTILVKDCLEM